jgi:hypothetical protein
MTKLEELKKALDVAEANIEDEDDYYEDADDYYWACMTAYIQELKNTKETTND